MTVRSRRSIIVVTALLALLGAGAWYVLSRDRDEPLTLYGNVDIREVRLAFRVDGRIAELTVDEGDRVEDGQVIARLDPDPLRTELEEAEAAIASSASQLQLLRAGNRAEDIEQARAALEEREAALRNLQADVARLTQLRASGATAERTYENAVNARDEAQARARAARQALRLQEAGPRAEEIARAEAELERSRAAAGRVRLRLADAELRAPSGGVILSRAVETGAIVQAGTTVFTEALTNPVWARIYVDARNLGVVAPGALVNLTTDSSPGKIYRGRVGYVSPTAEFTPKSVETPELRTGLVYRARVIVLDPDSRLRQGMPITVTLADAAPRAGE